MAITMAASPERPLPGRDARLTFSATTGNYFKLFCTGGPVGSDLQNQLDTKAATRIPVLEGDTGRPYVFRPDKGGVFTFVVQELTKGASTYGGGYQGAPASHRTETIIGETTVTLTVGQRLTCKLGISPDTATLVLHVWGDSIRQTTFQQHGEASPAIIEPESDRARWAIEVPAVQAALTALVDMTAADALGSFSDVTTALVDAFTAHLSHAGHAATDAYNALGSGYRSPSTNHGFQLILPTIQRRIDRHLRTDHGGYFADAPDPEFDPETAGDLQTWLEADQGVTESGGFVTAHANGGPLDDFAESDGNPATDPTVDTLNDEPSIFYGAQDYLQASNGTDYAFTRDGGGMTLIAVVYPTGTSGTPIIFTCKQLITSNTSGLALYYDADNERFGVALKNGSAHVYGSDVLGEVGSSPPGTLYVVTVRDSADDGLELRVNGTVVASAGPPPTNTHPSSNNGTVRLGYSNNPELGHLPVFLAFDGRFSDSVVGEAETFYLWKYADIPPPPVWIPGGTGTGDWHAPSGSVVADWTNLPAQTSASGQTEALMILADLWHSYEQHRQSTTVHASADTTNDAGTLPALLELFRVFVNETRTSTPTVPTTANPGVLPLITWAGAVEA